MSDDSTTISEDLGMNNSAVSADGSVTISEDLVIDVPEDIQALVLDWLPPQDDPITLPDNSDDQQSGTSKSFESEIRRSSRDRQPVCAARNDYHWTLAEKQALLKAVKKYGHLDMEHLCEAVPEKTKAAIETLIVKWCKRAASIRHREISSRGIDRCKKKGGKINIRKGRKQELAPLEQWVREVHKGTSGPACTETKLLAKAMLYISLFEKHPDPSECNGIDFSAVYDYLYRLLMGYPPKDLNAATARYVLDSLDNLAAVMKDGDFHRERMHLTSVHRVAPGPTVVKQYGRRKEDKKEEDTKPAVGEDNWMKTLLDIPGFNPLNVPLSLLKKQ